MRLKLYRAPSMAAAMAELRRELGSEALILGSRRVGGEVEITAALDPGAPDASTAAEKTIRRRDALAYHGVPEGLAGLLEGGEMAASLARHFRFAPLPLAPGGKPLLFAGPPGAGKTLTVARLATRLVLGGQRPLVISADGQRAGATEQLAAYTRLLGLSLLVASQPASLGRAMGRRSEGAPVLIDAPGCDPFDAAARRDLAALAGAAGAVLVVVLPAGLDGAESADLAAGFGALGATLMVTTRLDLARRLGGVLTAAAGGRLAFAEAGVSSNAADGLVPLTADFLAARLKPKAEPAQNLLLTEAHA